MYYWKCNIDLSLNDVMRRQAIQSDMRHGIRNIVVIIQLLLLVHVKIIKYKFL